MQCRDGSWGTKMRNNIFINDKASSIEVDNSSIYRLDSSDSVINTLDYVMPRMRWQSLAISLPEGSKTIYDITQEKAAGEFVRASNEPWVIIEGKWWRLNPNRPDFHSKAGSKLFSHWGDAAELPRKDISGQPRSAPSIGAYEPTQP